MTEMSNGSLHLRFHSPPSTPTQKVPKKVRSMIALPVGMGGSCQMATLRRRWVRPAAVEPCTAFA